MSWDTGKESMVAKRQEIDFLELFYALLDKLKLIITCALLGAIVMAFFSIVIATPVYQATSKLYVLNQRDSAINLSDLQIGSYLTSDYIEIFDTWEVQQMVIENLGLNITRKELREMVSVKNPANTRLLNITVSSNNPEIAALVANEFAAVAQRYISDVMQMEEPSLMSQALAPTFPVAPRKTVNVICGFIAGGALAVLGIALIHMLDDKVRTAEDVRRYVGLPMLAIVPSSAEGNGIPKHSGSSSKASASKKKRGING